jgi:hypothetical protein
LARLKVLIFVLAVSSAVAGRAEPGAHAGAAVPTSILRFNGKEALQIERRGFSFPIVEYTDERGARQQRKGIIASKIIAPDTLIGIGLFETTPKSHGYWGDVPPNVAPRRSKRAASVGLNWRF